MFSDDGCRGREQVKAAGGKEVTIDGATFKLTPDHCSFETKTETKHYRNYTPHVIEPSFGIDRVFTAVLEHSYYARPQDPDDKEKIVRGVLSLTPDSAPYKTIIMPLDQVRRAAGCGRSHVGGSAWGLLPVRCTQRGYARMCVVCHIQYTERGYAGVCAWHAVSGILLGACYAMSGILLRACYAVSGVLSEGVWGPARGEQRQVPRHGAASSHAAFGARAQLQGAPSLPCILSCLPQLHIPRITYRLASLTCRLASRTCLDHASDLSPALASRFLFPCILELHLAS